MTSPAISEIDEVKLDIERTESRIEEVARALKEGAGYCGISNMPRLQGRLTSLLGKKNNLRENQLRLMPVQTYLASSGKPQKYDSRPFPGVAEALFVAHTQGVIH